MEGDISYFYPYTNIMKLLRIRRVWGNIDPRLNSDYHPAAQPGSNASTGVLEPRREPTFATSHVPIHEGLMAII